MQTLSVSTECKEVTLDQLSLGTVAVVKRLDCECPELRHKLLVMGMVAGTSVCIDRIAPFGDPINCRIFNFSLSLRRCEAQHIWVEPA